MKTTWTLLVATSLIGCRGASHREVERQDTRTVAMDTATARRLCANADSVLAGQRSCELRDQRLIRTKP